MKSAPPTVPGMPSAYSRPARPRATVARARRPSCTAAPAWMGTGSKSSGGPSGVRAARAARGLSALALGLPRVVPSDAGEAAAELHHHAAHTAVADQHVGAPAEE